MKVFATLAAILAVASADAEPSYYRSSGVAYHPYSGSSFHGRTIYGGYPSYATGYRRHHIGKREAEAEPTYGYSPAYSFGYNVDQSHPGHARSYQSVHQAGGHSAYYRPHYIHKREAEAEPSYYYRGNGVAHHPYRATSYVAPTTYGASAYRGLNVYGGHPSYATGYRRHHIGKREAEAEPTYGYGPAYSFGYNVGQSHPGHARSYQLVHQAGGYSAYYRPHYIHKREADAEPSYYYRGNGVAHHPYRASAYVAPTTYGASAYRGRNVYGGHPSYATGYHGLRSQYNYGHTYHH